MLVHLKMWREKGIKRDAKFLFEGQKCGGVGQWSAHPPEFEQVDKKRFWPLLGNRKDQRRRGQCINCLFPMLRVHNTVFRLDTPQTDCQGIIMEDHNQIDQIDVGAQKLKY